MKLPTVGVHAMPENSDCCDFYHIMAKMMKHIVAVLLDQKPVYSKQALNEFAGYCGSESNLWSISWQWVCTHEFMPKTSPEYQFSCHDMGGNCHNMLHGSSLRRDGMCTSSLWNKARALFLSSWYPIVALFLSKLRIGVRTIFCQRLHTAQRALAHSMRSSSILCWCV